MEEQTIAARPSSNGQVVFLTVEDDAHGERKVPIRVDQIDEAVEKLLNAKQQAAAARLKGGR